jgi:hypothetical protein
MNETKPQEPAAPSATVAVAEVEIQNPGEFKRLPLRTHEEAHSFLMDPKRATDNEEFLFWVGALRSCAFWHFSIGPIGFSRYEFEDQREEDEQGDVPETRLKGCLSIMTGQQARWLMKELPKRWCRWQNGADVKKRTGTHQVEGRRGFHVGPHDEPLARFAFGLLIPVKFDRRIWPNAKASLPFVRQNWPIPFMTAREVKPSYKIAL